MGTIGQSITLANSIIGVGILAMPFCFQQCGIVLATLILLFMGLVSRLCSYYLLKSALLARRRNFEYLAFHAFGSLGKLAVEFGIIGFLMGTCIAYFVVVGDLGPQIIAKMLNINQSDILRTSIMVIVSVVCVLPLGLLRNVDSLSNVSAATIGFYMCLVLKVIAEAGSQLLAKDWHTKLDMWKPSGLLQCVPIFSMALFCQTQLFNLFESLPSLSLEKMTVVTKNAINICIAVYFTLGVFGYIAFGSQAVSGNVLMSLSQTMASDVIKLGFVMSLAFSFPLIIFPCRASLYSLLYKKVQKSSHHDHVIHQSIPETSFRCITVCIIAASLAVSLVLPNIELVLGLVGSTIGVLICLVFPAACFISITVHETNERILAKVIVVLGVFIMVLGTYANLQAAETQMERYDEKYITQERIDKMVEDFFEKKAKMAEDVIIKPVAHIDSVILDSVEKIGNAIIKDSEFQPPNPMPPESQSNEKKGNNIEMVDKSNKPVHFKDASVRPSDSHPRDLKAKLDGVKIHNGDKTKSNVNVKLNNKVPTNEENLNMKKQQQLIDTIKQHGEEQKELIKEQKEILDELAKTRDEIKKNKAELDNNEAKKKAVESIQEIAKIAINSLTGVSQDPIGPAGEKDEPLKILANKAVQNIEKKAADTLDAIKMEEQPKSEKVDLPKETIPKRLDSQSNVQPNQAQKINTNVKNDNTASKQSYNAAIERVKESHPEIIIHEESSKDAQNKKKNDEHKHNPFKLPEVPSHVNSNKNNIKANVIQEARSVDSGYIPSNNLPPSKSNVNHNSEENPQRDHLHSLEELQSYKQGKGLHESNMPEVKLTKGINPNVPLAIAMNGKSILGNIPPVNSFKTDVKLNNQDPVRNGAFNINNEQNIVRQKREVVDCAKKSTLKPEDKEICNKLFSKESKIDSQELPLSSVDLNNIAFQKRIPFDNYIARSLKSFKETDEKR